MSRRRLENALQVGRQIGEGSFTRVKEQQRVEIDRDHLYDGIYSLQYSFDGKILAVGFGDGGVELVSTETGKSEREIHKHTYGGLPVTCLRFNPEDQRVLFAASVTGKVHCCSLIDSTSSEIVEETGNEINCLDFCLDGSTFATAGKDLDVRLYDTKTQQLTKTYEGYRYHGPQSDKTSGHAHRIFALKFHPEHDELFITGGWDNHLKIWDSRTRDGVNRTIHGPHICGDSIDIRGQEILTGSWVANNALETWDFGEGKLIERIPFTFEGKYEGAFLYCAQFADSDCVLAGGSGTNSVQAINTKTQQLIGEVKTNKPVQAMDSTQGGRMFALGGVGPELVMASLL